MTHFVLDPDAARLDVLVNVLGVDQLAASRQLWGGRPLLTGADLAPLAIDPPDPRTATPAEHSTWVRAWVRELVADRMWRVRVWLARGDAS